MQTYQQFKQAQTVTDLYEAPDAKDYHKWVQEANRISDPATYVINDENDFDDGEPNYLEKKRQEMEEARAQFEPGEPPELPPDDDGGPGPWGEDLSKSAPKPKVEAPPPSPVDTARQNNPGMAISNTGNFKQTGTLPNGTKFVQAGNNVNTIKTPQQMMYGGRTTKPVQAPLVKTQSYNDFSKQAADEQAPWYTGIQDWIKENPNLAAGGTALLAAAPLYLLGRGFGRKRDRLLGLLTAIAGGGAAFYGMKNWGVPWLAGLGQEAATTAPESPKGSNTVMPTNTYGFNPHAAPAKQPAKAQAQQKQAPVKTQQPASNTVPVANGGGKRTDAYVKGIQQFRQNMEAKFGPADKWKPELMQHYQLQAKNFFNDPTYKMQLPGK